ncbi:MAG: hypothetical protein HGA42_12035 [Nostocales cyanobacterium W4_Combined_metabat2_030]|jgi:hypothetical protein|nr:hypothetical protein [Nostocales cyanobacterium W4_Combined_metabat2_030]
MKNDNSGQQVMAGLILIVLVIGLLKGCGDGRFEYRYNSCMEGTNKISGLFKAVFVCLWV